MTEQAHSWFNSSGSSDSVQRRNLAPSAENFLLEKERLKSVRAAENTRKSRQWGNAQKANCCTQVHCSCLCAFPQQKTAELREQLEKDREMEGRTTLISKFDKLRRWRLSKRWGRIKMQKRANNSVSLSNRNSWVFSYHKGKSRFYIR